MTEAQYSVKSIAVAKASLYELQRDTHGLLGFRRTLAIDHGPATDTSCRLKENGNAIL